MVDASESCESQYVTVDLVRESKSKLLEIKDAGEYQETDYGRKLTFMVEIEGKKKIWRPNRDTCCNLKSKFGAETSKWNGAEINLQIIKVQGKDSVIGLPKPATKIEEVGK